MSILSKSHRYTPGDYVHFARFYWRGRRRMQQWGKDFEGAWRGWIAPSHEQHDYGETVARLRYLLRQKRFRLLPPYAVTGPSHLRGKDFEEWFSNYLNTFGNESCFMPFYWARIHANGDLIFCPGHPDVIAGTRRGSLSRRRAGISGYAKKLRCIFPKQTIGQDLQDFSGLNLVNPETSCSSCPMSYDVTARTDAVA